jgi:hypothetical protein
LRPDPQDITAIDEAALNPVQREPIGKAGGGRGGLAGARGRARPSDYRMTIENEGGVLDENAIGMVDQVRQTNDLESGSGKRLFVGGVLGSRLANIDGRTLEVS